MPATAPPAEDLLTLLREGVHVERALQRAARRAIREHREEGLPLAMWRDGEVVWMAADVRARGRLRPAEPALRSPSGSAEEARGSPVPPGGGRRPAGR